MNKGGDIVAGESEIWMSNMGSSLPSRGRKEDEGVAIPRCALMASSSLEELREFSGNYLFFGPTPARGVSGVFRWLQTHGRGSFQLLVKLHQGVPWPSNGPVCPLAIPDGSGNALIPARSSLKFKLI